jgi:electron transfer flavoprotein alpha subunit
MSVLIFIDQSEGHVKKASFEAMSYGAKVAELLGTTAEGVFLGTAKEDLPALGKYGVKKIHHVQNEVLNHFDAQVFTKVIAQVVQGTGAQTVIFSNNVDGKSIAPRLAARLKAGLVPGAVALPETGNGFTVKKNVFSGKAFANISVKSAVKVISLNPNAYPVTEPGGTAEEGDRRGAPE